MTNDESFQNGYEKGYHRAQLDYGLEDDDFVSVEQIYEVKEKLRAKYYNALNEPKYCQGISEALDLLENMRKG